MRGRLQHNKDTMQILQLADFIWVISPRTFQATIMLSHYLSLREKIDTVAFIYTIAIQG